MKQYFKHVKKSSTYEKLSEYDQEMPQSHTIEQPMAQRGTTAI